MRTSAAQFPYRCAGLDGDAGRPARLGDRDRQPADAAADAVEDRAGGARRGGFALDRAGGLDERAAVAHRRIELRDRGAQRDLIGVAGVDAAEQRLHQPVHHLVAEPGGDVGADRDVVADLGTGQYVVERQPGEAGRGEQSGGGERPEVAGDAHHMAPGHLPQLPPGPHGGAEDGGRFQLVGQAHLAGQADRFGAAGQQRLGAEVHRDTGDLVRPELAAEAPGGFEQRHPGSRCDQVVGGGEARDPAADDHHMPRGERHAVRLAHALHCLRFRIEFRT